MLSQQSDVEFSLEWLSDDGRTYFVQHSSDLTNWNYFTTIRSGDGSMLSYDVYSSLEVLFLRLEWTDQEDQGDPYAVDFDGDGLTTEQELNGNPQTSPLAWDTDGDGYNDQWEINYGFDPTKSHSSGNAAHSADIEADTLNNILESLIGSNPNVGFEMLPVSSERHQIYTPH